MSANPCDKCYKPSRFECSVCHSAYYCSKKCQTAHWSLHMLQCNASINKHHPKKKASSGVGYGGDARRDEQTRKAGKKAALKRETQAWKEWQTELQGFTQQKHPHKATGSGDQDSNAPATVILNTLKQVLRQTPQDWWWAQPQRKLYVTALQVCSILTEHYPTAWGDPEDEESAMAALDALAQTSKLLVKQLGKQQDTNNNNLQEAAAASGRGGLMASAASWLTSQRSATHQNKPTHDKDASLPLRVMELRDQAASAVSFVLEKPECSMMGSQDYYRQALRPLAFETVETFDKPRHYFSAGGGHATQVSLYSALPTMSIPGGFPGTNYGKSKAKKGPAAKKRKDDSSNGVKSSATVLWKELSTYPTALPIEYGSSIFVRTLENEMDKLRVLIIGPEDTPYANGCFLFDVTMGNDYPHLPPKVQFLTTASFLSATDRKVRFNPNLYEDGKVCLSLLGTWSGPGWQSKESTLLQVLVSIQSLILGVAEPYYNEPGYERSQGTKQGKLASDQYNKTIRRQTLQVAILPFLKNQLRDGTNHKSPATAASKRKDPPSGDATGSATPGYFDEFSDVIQQHFRLKQQVIQKQLFGWLQEDKTLEPLYTEYWNVWDQLEQQWQLASGLPGGSHKGAAKRAAKKRAKVDAPASNVEAPAVKMKDGVILLDDDSDIEEQLEADIAKAIQMSVTQAVGGCGEDVIELADSDNEGGGKPAAVNIKSRKKRAQQQAQQNSGEESGEGHPAASVAVKPVAVSNDVVDLT